jgi:hypothetical protein
VRRVKAGAAAGRRASDIPWRHLPLAFLREMYLQAVTIKEGGVPMKVVVLKSPKILAPLMRLIFKIKK